MEPQKTAIERILLNVANWITEHWGKLLAIAAVLFPVLNAFQAIGFLEQWPNLGATLISIIAALGAALGRTIPAGTFPDQKSFTGSAEKRQDGRRKKINHPK